LDIIAFRLHGRHSVALPGGSVVFVRGGTAAWRTRSSGVLLDANHALLFPDGSDPAALTAYDGPASLTLFHDASIDLGGSPSVRIAGSADFTEHFFLTLSARDAAARDRFERLVCRLRNAAREKPETRSAHSPSYGRLMQQHVNAALGRPFRLDEIASAVALSPYTASRVFHREAGLPLRIYNRRLRLRTALARIADRHALSQVALELGFFDHAHFTKAFRAEFGMTPSEWRATAYKTLFVTAA